MSKYSGLPLMLTPFICTGSGSSASASAASAAKLRVEAAPACAQWRHRHARTPARSYVSATSREVARRMQTRKRARAQRRAPPCRIRWRRRAEGARTAHSAEDAASRHRVRGAAARSSRAAHVTRRRARMVAARRGSQFVYVAQHALLALRMTDDSPPARSAAAGRPPTAQRRGPQFHDDRAPDVRDCRSAARARTTRAHETTGLLFRPPA